MHDAFADPEVDIVLNLTRPYEHFAVTKAALEAGKHVYSEKPLGASLEEGIQLRALAEEKGLMLGGAPDTFLGAGIQTCRRLIDDGFIGQPIGSAAYMIGSGHESWHPDPEFYYQIWRRPDVRYGALLPHRHDQLAGRRERSDERQQDHFPAAHHHQPAAGGHGDRRGRFHLCGRHGEVPTTGPSAPSLPLSM